MASKYLQKYPVPAGFQQILADFTREVLRDQPPNIIQYAAKYFQMLQKGQKFQFNSKVNVSKQDKKYELSYNPKNAEQITKKAANIAARVQDSGKPSHNKPIPKPAETSKVQSKKAPQIKQQKKQARAPVMQNPKVKMLPDDVVKDLNRIFDEIDMNKNGLIQPDQIRKAVQYFAQQGNFSQKINQAQIKQIISTFDVNQDGKISRQQFINYVAEIIVPLAQFSENQQQLGTQKTVNQQQVQNYMNEKDQQIFQQQIRQQVNMAFNQFDKDKNGFLSSKQIKSAVQQVLGPGFYVDTEKLQKFIAVIDNNHDGKVSKEELYNFLLNFIEQSNQAMLGMQNQQAQQEQND